MANYKEIVTKAVIAKGKKSFTTKASVNVNNKPSTILGCWVINHNFSGEKIGKQISINGSYDVNYNEIISMHSRDEESSTEEIIVRSLKQPNCVKVDINGNSIEYVVEKELGIELVDDVKVKVEASGDEDRWDEIPEEEKTEDIEKKIDKEVEENFIDEAI